MSNKANSKINNKDIDQESIHKFMGQVMADLGGAYSAVLVYIGYKLGLYRAMADASKPLTSQDLAALTKTSERNIREWLANQAAGGYVKYEPQSQTYSISRENAFTLVDENSPSFVIGAFLATMSFFKDASKIMEAFKTGKGLSWGDHDPDLFVGTEKFFKPSYNANLISSWIPSLDNGRIQEKLLNKEKSAVVADVGCGHGISTIIMAQAFPNSRFIGFDNHNPSIVRARELAKQEGLNEERIIFEPSSANEYPSYPKTSEKYDLITFFDCLHDLGDPVGAASHALRALKSNGSVMIVEPFANDRLEDNLNPLGRMYYAASTMACVPGSMASNGLALGAQAGEKKIGNVMRAGGFNVFRRSTQTAFNIVYEARP
jgi:SAM-dependent methyltransferase